MALTVKVQLTAFDGCGLQYDCPEVECSVEGWDVPKLVEMLCGTGGHGSEGSVVAAIRRQAIEATHTIQALHEHEERMFDQLHVRVAGFASECELGLVTSQSTQV